MLFKNSLHPWCFCGLGMQQYAMHNATIQKTTFFELGVCQGAESEYFRERLTFQKALFVDFFVEIEIIRAYQAEI